MSQIAPKSLPNRFSMGNYCASPVDPSDRHPPLPTHRKNKFNPFSIKSNGGIGGAGGSLTELNSPTGRDILAPCDLGDELGRSRFGVTYLCTDKSTDDQFACKLFRLNAWRRGTVAIKKMLHDKRYKNRELCV